MLIGFEFRRREIGGGGKGIRTPDLLIANETLYQLSYTPILPMKNEPRLVGRKTLLHTGFVHSIL